MAETIYTYKDRSANDVIMQMGVGTANLLLPTAQLAMNPTGSAWKEFRRANGAYVTQVQASERWAESSLQAGFDFNEALIWLAGNIGAAAAPTPTDPAGGYEWYGEVKVDQASPKRFFKIQQGYRAMDGSNVAVESFAQVAVPDLTLKLGRGTGLEISGKLLGRYPTLGIGGMDAATVLRGLPAADNSFGLWGADTMAELDSAPARLDPAGYEVTHQRNNVFVTDSVADDSYRSYRSLVTGQIADKSTLEMSYDVVGADYNGRFNLVAAEVGEIIYLRTWAVGPEILAAGVGIGVNYGLIYDRALQISAEPSKKTRGGVQTLEWTLQPVFDPLTGIRERYWLTNDVASLPLV